jgi:hypothetical protein
MGEFAPEYFTSSQGERFYLSPDGDWLIWEKQSPTVADDAHRGLIYALRRMKPVGPLAELLERVAHEHKMSVEAMLEKDRTAGMVAARADFAMRARRAGYSLPRIGRALQRDHSTVSPPQER